MLQISMDGINFALTNINKYNFLLLFYINFIIFIFNVVVTLNVNASWLRGF